jgi:hypothetical protein
MPETLHCNACDPDIWQATPVDVYRMHCYQKVNLLKGSKVKIAVTSQNFKSVTGHAGKSRRYIIFNIGTPCDSPEVVWLDLPLEMSIHEFTGGAHPLDEMDVILTASAGPGFVEKLAQRGVRVITCGETDPRKAVRDFLTGTVKAVNPHSHLELERHEHELGSCCCGV